MEPVLETTLALTAEEASAYSTILEATSLLPKSDPRYGLVIGVTWWLLHRRRRLEQQLVRRRHFSRRIRRLMTMRWHLQRTTLHGLASAFEGTEQALLQQLEGLPEKRLWVNRERQTEDLDFWTQFDRRELSPDEFRKNFHMSQETFDFLYSELEEHLQKTHTTMREPLPAKKRLAATLCRLATNTEYLKVASLFGIGKSTTTSLVRDVCEVIIANFKSRYLNLGITEEKIAEASKKFEIPQSSQVKVIGVLGSIDVFIAGSPWDWNQSVSGPGPYSSIYSQSYGLVFQALVDHNEQFSHVVANSPAGLSNIDILKKSSLDDCITESWSSFLENENDAETDIMDTSAPVAVPALLVVADQSYNESSTSKPCFPWLLVPAETDKESESDMEAEHEQDEKIYKALKVFEEAVARLKSRWKIFHGKNGKINFNADAFENIALACCILHNICEQRGDDIDQSWTVDVNVKESLFLRKGRPVPVPVGDDRDNDKSMNNDIDTTTSLKVEVEEEGEDLVLTFSNDITNTLNPF